MLERHLKVGVLVLGIGADAHVQELSVSVDDDDGPVEVRRAGQVARSLSAEGKEHRRGKLLARGMAGRDYVECHVGDPAVLKLELHLSLSRSPVERDLKSIQQ